MSTTVADLTELAAQANRDLEGASALEILAWAHGEFGSARGDLLDGRHSADPSRRAGGAGRRCDLPRYGLPLRGDDRHRDAITLVQRQCDQRDARTDGS